MHRKLLLVSVATAVSLLSGCATFHKAHLMEHQTYAKALKYKEPAAESLGQVTNRPFIMGSQVRVIKSQPSILEQDITMESSANDSLRQIASNLSSKIGIPVVVEGVSSTSTGSTLPSLPGMSGMSGGSSSSSNIVYPIPLNWQNGSISGFLNMITAKKGLWWNYENGIIKIFRIETRTFSIPALAWGTDSKGSIMETTGASGGSSGGSTGGLGGSSGSSGESTGETSIKNVSKVSMWDDLQKTAQTVAGDGAQVMASPSEGNITVTGTPPEIDRVKSWVKQLSRQMSQQVEITVHVYNVKLTNQQNYGLNLQGVVNSIGSKYGISLQGVAPPNPTGGVAPMGLGADIISQALGQGVSGPYGQSTLYGNNTGNNQALGQMGAQNGNFAQPSGSAVAVQALSTLGNVSETFERSAVTVSGEPVPIQVAKETGYLMSSGTTNTANVGSSTMLMPGTVTTGFTALFLPKVVHGKILLGMNMTISSLLAINTLTSGSSEIQVPDVDSSSFQQMVSLKSGQTLLLTGFKKNDGQTNHNGTFTPHIPILGGGGNASVEKDLIAIVITARVI